MKPIFEWLISIGISSVIFAVSAWVGITGDGEALAIGLFVVVLVWIGAKYVHIELFERRER